VNPKLDGMPPPYPVSDAKGIARALLAGEVRKPLHEQTDQGKKINPALVANYVIRVYEAYLQRPGDDIKARLEEGANELLSIAEDCGEDGLVWRCDYHLDTPGYDCKPGFTSAMAQGQAASALLRAHAVTPGKEYDQAAMRALPAFEKDIRDGGVSHTDQAGDRWFEEFACPKRGSPLNGFIYSLIGLKELEELGGSERAGELFRLGAATVKKHLDDYELRLPTFKWTRYDNKRQPLAPVNYHGVHIEQMEALFGYTGDETFKARAERWKAWRDKYEPRHARMFRRLQTAAKILRGLRLMRKPSITWQKK